MDYYNDDINQCNSTKLASKGAKIYWKIIRINGDGSIRLIYNGPGLNYSNYAISQSTSDGWLSGVVGGVPYNLASSDRKYTGYTYDNGTSSFIKNEVDTWYNNTLGRNSNYDSQVILGRFCSDSSNYNYDSKGSFASGSRLAATSLDLEQYNNPTFICPSTTENFGGSYQLKAGLITADEIVFAGENIYVHGDSYLNIGSTSYWSMTPSFFGYDHINAANWIMTSGNYMYDWGVSSYSYGIRPVINLSVSNMSLQGDGTSGNPYILVPASTDHYTKEITIEKNSKQDVYNIFEATNLSGNIAWTSQNEGIAIIENEQLVGLEEGTTTITGINEDGTTYEITVNVLKNPETNTMVYVIGGIIVMVSIATLLVIIYRKNNRKV